MSSTRILLAAEADRIQDLLFRSSRLREVSGGSSELNDFWRDAAAHAERVSDAVGVAVDIWISAGGALRLLLEGSDPVALETLSMRLKRDIADAYAARFGGRITLAFGTEGNLMEDAAARLAQEKLRGDPPAVPIHLPHIRPCTSCGREPAARYRSYQGDKSEEWLCEICYRRVGAADVARKRFLELSELNGVREEIQVAISVAGGDPNDALPPDADAVGAYDSRGMVAYLLADGNGFGQVFSGLASDPEALKGFSALVSDAGARSLARSAAALYEATPTEDRGFLPVVPLITGGDDVLALIPAPSAFWFAQTFVERYLNLLQSDPLTREAVAGASLSCALVFCKATFPYRLAYQIGERALHEVKAQVPMYPGLSLVRGVEVQGTVQGAALGPVGEYGCFVLTGESNHPLSVSVLFEAKDALSEVARKRRTELERLFNLPERSTDSEWQSEVEELLVRGAGGKEEVEAQLAALMRLAEGRKGLLCAAPSGRMSSATADLLHLWNYLSNPEESVAPVLPAPAVVT